MPAIAPLYTEQNTKCAYQLNWSLSLFWKDTPIDTSKWLMTLREQTEMDGVRILEHRITDSTTSQFLLSTIPLIPPKDIIRYVKGRLQYLIKAQQPKAFSRSYSIISVGSARREAVESYVREQLGHHRMADENVQQDLHRYQYENPVVNLSNRRRTEHGEFVFNLHLVYANKGRWNYIEEDILTRTTEMAIAVAKKKQHLLSSVGILPDHIHLTLGCNINESPLEVALGYMNNFAYIHDMRDVFMHGCYMGTFGDYDLGAIRDALR